MNHHGDKSAIMQAEMARFENEISGGGMARMPPRFPPGNMSLRFVPHSLLRPPGGAAFPPPPNLAAMHARAAARIPLIPPRPPFPFAALRPPAPPPPPAPVSVIEAAPTKYQAPEPTSTYLVTPAIPDFKPTMKIEPTIVETKPAPVLTQTLAFTPQAGSGLKPAATTSTTTATGKQPKLSHQPGGSSRRHQMPKKNLRISGDDIWRDDTLAEWDPNDYRIFCGDLGNEVSDELLAKAFRKYSTFQKAKVIRDKRTNKTKGYGFVSFRDPQDFIRAMREMDGKYVGNRPIKLKKSSWKDRNLTSSKKKERRAKKLGIINK